MTRNKYCIKNYNTTLNTNRKVVFYIKKLIFIVLTVLIICITAKRDTLTIPDEAIRMRVVANSNTLEDQALKLKVYEELESELYAFLKNANNIEQARIELGDNLNKIDKVVNTTLLNNNFNYGYSINLGLNYFPYKEYKGVIYEEGNYESLVVTLGEGIGDNWWCILFPPLCLLEAEESAKEDIEYQFYVKKLIDKYWK